MFGRKLSPGVEYCSKSGKVLCYFLLKGDFLLVFAYRARDRQGRRVTGQVEAENKAAAAASLWARGFFVIDLNEASNRRGPVRPLPFIREKVSARELALFSRQSAALIDAGVPVLRALRILTAQAPNRRLRDTLDEVAAAVERGSSLAGAFRRHPDVFPSVFTSLVEAGELGGQLNLVLERLSVHYEKEHLFREKMRSVLTYPLIVLAVAVLAVAVLTTFVLPTLAGVLTETGVPLPLLTEIVIRVSESANRYWYLVFASLTVLPVALRHLVGTPWGRDYWDRALLRIPVFGHLAGSIIIARFCRTFASLIKSGVPILQALDVLAKTVGNAGMARAIEEISANVGQGESIAVLLERSRLFPRMVTQMIVVGEETGALDKLLEKVAVYYEQDVDQTVSRLASALEPVLILAVGGVVGLIIISVLLPLLGAIAGIS
ncbi:type II secretion system protein [Candidatus Desulforudis audaxviator MP104C]|uniref:Type II secretion system protein n=1 Tax=Desulforudis audaxviator (strain MP104C) TaxID=477974 RepID=B1I3A2_DESAP|nr:type II secretion system protein [Candidatus Desulforudis audaxviator MP104C]